MKKIALILPLLIAPIVGVTGCTKDSRSQITYGTLVDKEATRLTYSALKVKVENKENMLVVVYQEGMQCGCWTTFSAVINKYVQEYHTKIYKISAFDFPSEKESFGLTVITDTATPSIGLFKSGKLTNEFIKKDDNKTMFESVEGLRNAVKRIAKDPQYLYVNQDYLDNALFTEKVDKVVINYIRATCPDCTYSFPNVLKPYGENNDFTTKVWLIDLDVEGIRCDKDGNCNSNLQTYIDFKDNHLLSTKNNETLGYSSGVVPTMQVWEKGELKDMTVFFNDTVSLVNDTYQITESYYTEERIKSLGYTTTVLLGKTLSNDEVDAYDLDEDGVNDYYSWKQESAIKEHQPILEAFLNKYVL